MIAIIDGDVLAYQACRPRWQEKAPQYIKYGMDGKKIPIEYTKEEDRKYMEESWQNFQDDLQKVVDATYSSDFLMAVGGDSSQNFRKIMYPDYKGHRQSDNLFVPAIRKLAVLNGLAVEADDREADDCVRFWAEESRAHGIDYTICSIDKDLRCIPGKYYHLRDKKLEVISEADALRFYYAQLMAGDPTDKIPGVPGIAMIKALKALDGYDSEEDFQEVVVSMYIDAYEDDWKNMLLSNGKMIHIQKTPTDYFNFDNWPIVREL